MPYENGKEVTREADNVWVETTGSGLPIRIFRTDKAAFASGLPDGRLRLMAYKAAVGIIRRLVFIRAKWRCTHCGEAVTWQMGQMHERNPRGKIRKVAANTYCGGEISLANSILLCYSCHSETDAGHGKRRPQFGSNSNSPA